MDNYDVNPSYVYGGSLFWIIVGCIVGYFIGNSKNRPVLGFFLGLILGCIGWIIMLFIPTKHELVPAGWYPDPYGRHQRRYFNGASWQAQVIDNGVESIDDPATLPPMPPQPPTS